MDKCVLTTNIPDTRRSEPPVLDTVTNDIGTRSSRLFNEYVMYAGDMPARAGSAETSVSRDSQPIRDIQPTAAAHHKTHCEVIHQQVDETMNPFGAWRMACPADEARKKNCRKTGKACNTRYAHISPHF